MNLKRSREIADESGLCSRLDINSTGPEAWGDNMDTLSRVKKMCPMGHVKVVTVAKGWNPPVPFANITNSILFLDEKYLDLDWDAVVNLLTANKTLTIYVFTLVLVAQMMESSGFLTFRPVDWGRIRAANIIIAGYPHDRETYQRLFRDAQQSAGNVYQAVGFGPLQLDWHADNHLNFVVMEPDFFWQAALGQLRPGCTALHLGTLNANRKHWTDQVLSELQTKDLDPKRRKLAVGSLRQTLDDALYDSIRNPAVEKQLYHDFNPRHAILDDWLAFLNALQEEHPQFCQVRGDMFKYKKKKLLVNPNLLATIRTCDPQRRFIVGVLGIDTRPDAHANALVLDRDTNTLSRFEPYGSEPQDYTADLDAQFRDFVLKHNDHGFSVYEPPSAFCAVVGPQNKADVDQYMDFEEPRVDHFDRGWCALISLMFIHHRLAHPEKSIRDVEKMMSDKSAGQLAFEIRSYGNHVTLKTMATSGIIRDRQTDFLKTTVTILPTSVDAKTSMSKYPRTKFRMAPSSIGSPYVLVKMAGNLVGPHGRTLVVTSLRTKMAEVDPKLITDMDAEMISNAELVTFYHVLDALKVVDTVNMTINASSAVLDEGKDSVGSAGSAIRPHSIQERADFYIKFMGFQVTMISDAGDVTMATTKQNIDALYFQQFCDQITIDPWDPTPEHGDPMTNFELVQQKLQKVTEHCQGGKTKKIKCKGPLAGEDALQPFLPRNEMAWELFTRQLFNLSPLIELPSLNVTYVPSIQKQDHVLHIQEIVFEDPSILENESHPAFRIWRLIKDQFVRVDRWVFRIALRRENVGLINSTAEHIRARHAGADMYLVLNPVSEETLDVARDVHLNNFIVNKKYETKPPAILKEFLSTAKAVLYRSLDGKKQKD